MFPVGNILNRGHIYFQDFWKCSSILNKAKQLQFNRKQKPKQKKRKKKLKGKIIAKKKIFISGMHCQHCVDSVTDSLNQIDGVSAKVDLAKGWAEVSLDREVEDDVLIAAVEKEGFSVDSVQNQIC